MSDLAYRDAAALVEMIRRREISCRELLEHQIARIASRNPSINAVVTLDEERARSRADQADERLARGDALGPLHGLPLTVKDTFETEGLRTTAGAPQYADHVPDRDATAVARLRRAGAIVIGKTNTPLLAGDWQTHNALFGTTCNPWDPERAAGGSSGGSAAALCAGLTPLELGSDIGGSVRVPSSWCGVYGHKPSWGVVPQRGHIPPAPGVLAQRDLNVVGPLARSAGDLELALDAIAGPDGPEAAGWRLELPAPRRTRLRDYRVAAWLDDPAYAVDSAVRERLEAAVAALRADGVRVDTDARPPFDLGQAIETYQRLLMPIMAGDYPQPVMDAMRKLAAQADPDEKNEVVRAARRSTASHTDWIEANEVRERCCAGFADFFRDWDILLSPITAVAAIAHDHEAGIGQRTIRVNGIERPYTDLFGWVGAVTMCRLPATVAPVGRTPEGLPVGVQVIGAHLEDRTTIDFARRLADVVGGFEVPPGY